MTRPYVIGDIVLASDIALDIKGELVELVAEKNINPVGWCYQWAASGGKPGLWMPTDSIIRHATPEEVAEFAGARTDILQREIDIHRAAIKILEAKLSDIAGKATTDEPK